VKTRLIPRDAIFGSPEKSSARISPDGTRLAFLAPFDGKTSVWTRTLDGGDERMIAHDPARAIRWTSWQGDGRHVLYLQDKAGNENFHLFQVPSDGDGAARELTPGDDVRCTPIAIDARFPDEALIALNARNVSLFDVHRVDFRTGDVRLDTENPGNVVEWCADHAFTVRGKLVQEADGSMSIHVRDGTDAPWREIDRVALADSAPQFVTFSHDNAALYVISAKSANAGRLVKFDLARGSQTVVFEDAHYDVDRVYVDPVLDEPVAVGVLRDRLTWTCLDDRFAETFAALQRLHDADFAIDDASADGNVLIVRYTFDAAPTRYYAFDRRSRAAMFLFDDRPALLEYTLAPMQPVSFVARDGLTIHGYLTLPPGDGTRPFPAVLLVHGGPWHRDRWGYDDLTQWLANRGYAVLQVNFRGSTGYGKDFLNAGNREFAGTMRTDLLDARDWLIAQGVADRKRFAIMGGSYGGYAVLTALAFTPDAFTCGVDIVGPSNLNTLLASIPPYWEPMRKLFHERMGEDPAFLESHSPLFKAAGIRVPLLIAQGANDPRVKQQESDQIVEALRGNGIPVTYLVFENEGHGFANPENYKRFTALAEKFLAENLGGLVQPPDEDEAFEAFLR
jgi:dipeptidyl aminopeptidase/acylaminoacyl peptidase